MYLWMAVIINAVGYLWDLHNNFPFFYGVNAFLTAHCRSVPCPATKIVITP